MSIEGADDTKAAFDRVLAGVTGQIPKALEASAILVQGEAKTLAPVDTGNLRNSITRETHEDYAIVGTNVEYGPFQEFGTSKMAAQPFLTPALNRNRSRIVQLISAAVKKGAES